MKLKYILLAVALMIGGSIYYGASRFNSCLGRMQQCYSSYRAQTSGVDRLTQERQTSIHGGFTASLASVAFQIPLGNGTNGIILVSRSGNHARLISTEGYSHWSPRFSADGDRLVFGRARIGSGQRELMSCEVRTWQCAVLFRTSGPIASPIDAGNGVVLFSTIPPRSSSDGKSRRFDIFAVRKGQPPTQLTNYQVYELGSLSLGGNKIFFGADGKSGFEEPTCSEQNAFNCDKSNIFALDFDPTATNIINEPKALKPLFVVKGYSSSPVASQDGARVAFLNTNRRGNPFRYNIAIADANGTVDGGLPVQGFAFSSAAFVGDVLLVNELFDDRYRILSIDLASKKVEGLEVRNSPEYLKTVEPIALSVDGLPS